MQSHFFKVAKSRTVTGGVCPTSSLFTDACWSSITCNSYFMHSNFRMQSELRVILLICYNSRYCFILYYSLFHVCSPIYKGHDDLT